MPRPRLRHLALVLLLAACSADPGDTPGPGPDPDPDPEFDIDLVVFRVITYEAAGREKLRWIGTWEGPLPDSPEPTRWPWIGFSRGFRVEWKAYSEDRPIAGTRYRVSQLDTGPWLPSRTGIDHVSSFEFENLVDPADLPSDGCAEGMDCAGLRRFASGRHRLQVRAVTEDGREIDPDLGELRFEVNYPPSTRIVFDPASGPDDPLASPVAWWTLQDGSTRRVALAEGDTVPSGATLRVRLRGQDRLRSHVATDSFCCDDRLEASGPEVTNQGFAGFWKEDARGVRDSLFTLIGETSADSFFTLSLGPFDYGPGFRSIDEHGRRGDTTALHFVAGFPPELPSTTIGAGSEILLHPTRDPGPGEGEFTRSPETRMYWNVGLQGWSSISGESEFTGRWYEIPLRFRGEPDPRVRDVSPLPPADAAPKSSAYSDHVRSFAYELVHEADPLNVIQNGPGDRSDLFLDVDRLGELDLEGERTWRVFIPNVFFEDPSLFDPDGPCVNDNYCAIGGWLKERLGTITLRLRAQTTGSSSLFDQLAPVPAARAPVVDLSRSGRFSPVLERGFSVRVALTDDADQLLGRWPPAAP